MFAEASPAIDASLIIVISGAVGLLTIGVLVLTFINQWRKVFPHKEPPDRNLQYVTYQDLIIEMNSLKGEVKVRLDTQGRSLADFKEEQNESLSLFKGEVKSDVKRAELKVEEVTRIGQENQQRVMTALAKIPNIVSMEMERRLKDRDRRQEDLMEDVIAIRERLKIPRLRRGHHSVDNSEPATPEDDNENGS